MRAKQTWLLVPLFLLLTRCMQWPDATDPRPRNEILWTRATRAIDQQRCDVARLTIQTLINTYPDSRYALDAEDVLRTDPRLQPCRQDPDTKSFTTWYVGAPDVSN